MERDPKTAPGLETQVGALSLRGRIPGWTVWVMQVDLIGMKGSGIGKGFWEGEA
jgi:hypothetical protein